jgi:hypothetical protein
MAKIEFKVGQYYSVKKTFSSCLVKGNLVQIKAVSLIYLSLSNLSLDLHGIILDRIDAEEYLFIKKKVKSSGHPLTKIFK